MYYFPTYIGSEGKEDAAIAIMHTLSYMIAFTCVSLITCTIFLLI